ncbi:GNAT family N-acetyltransferase [Paenibacillus methanolicus]|uniref:Putative acetyltransferase n=1 Tax=Paenibacillus methanolicus TaxID=582686 RepID=A0A5S5CB36_9BACL|nr:GNAT family N-acetyltransferase [Paenibacillus methanolicus]TYP75566.1 putative acetyltransferase [Paenibacillus methanolicus]
MPIRQLTSEEFESSMALAQYAFQIHPTPERREEMREKFKPETVWGVFNGTDLEAQLRIIPFELYLYGRQLRMGGIAAVSTWPEQRRKGHVNELLLHALKVMREAGQTISCLAPFAFPFYRKYGWELYVDYKKYTVATALLPRRVATAGQVERTEGDIAELNKVYERYAARYNGTLVRTEAWWQDSVFRRKKKLAAVYKNEAGQAAGYILYEIAERAFNINEMVYLDETARQALWTFVANHDSMIDKVTLEAPMDDNLPYLLPNPRIGQEIVPYFMGRIVDAPAFVEQLRLRVPEGASDGEPITLFIRDEHAPWNDGHWRLEADEAGLWSLRRSGSGGSGEAGAELSCGIGTLTALLMGYQRPERLLQDGKLTGADEAASRLERIIPRSQTNLLDFF